MSSRSNGRRVYVGKLDSYTRERDLDDVFGKFGKIVAVDMKRGYAFVVCVTQFHSYAQ